MKKTQKHRQNRFIAFFIYIFIRMYITMRSLLFFLFKHESQHNLLWFFICFTPFFYHRKFFFSFLLHVCKTINFTGRKHGDKKKLHIKNIKICMRNFLYRYLYIRFDCSTIHLGAYFCLHILGLTNILGHSIVFSRNKFLLKKIFFCRSPFCY